MKRLKQITITSIVLIITLLIGIRVIVAEGVNTNLNEIYNQMRNHDSNMFNYSGQDLISTYGNGFNLDTYSGNNGPLGGYAGNPNLSCLNEHAPDNGNLKGMIRVVIDVDSSGDVQISTPSYEGQAREQDKEKFNSLACICEKLANRNSATDWGAWYMAWIASSTSYGINAFRIEGGDVAAANGVPGLVGGLPQNNRIEDGKRMRIILVSFISQSGEAMGQERMYFGEAPYDPTPGPGKLRLVKVNSKTDERIPGIQFKIKRTGNNKAPTGYIQVVGKFGKNDIIPGSPIPSSSPSSSSDGQEQTTQQNTSNVSGDDTKEDRAIPGPITGVGQESGWEIRYTPIEKDATIFETDSNGEIYISGLMSGDYVAEELEGEMSGAFEIVPETTTFKVKKCPDDDVTKGEDSKAVIKNEPITTTVELDKTDMINGQSLDGAGFKLQNTDTGEWVTDPNAKKPEDKLSNDEANAYEFFTENGKISVPGLPPGNYKWVETTFPDNPRTDGKYVALDKDAGGFPVSGGKGETVNTDAQNKPVGLFRKVVKGTDKGIQGVPFEFREYNIKEEYMSVYPELWTNQEYYHGESLGGTPCCETGQHCEIYLCDCVDEPVLVSPATKYRPAIYKCTKHGQSGYYSAVKSHCDEWMKKRDERNDLAKKVNEIHRARENGRDEINTGSKDGKRNNLTDENGNIDISPLVPDGDDGKGKFQYREIDEGMENPYFNNDHPDWTDFDYLGKTIVEDERRRMDIEGLIWVERSKDQKGGIDDPETIDGIYNEGQDQLLYPVEVRAKHGDIEIGQGVITADGRYRIRVGGRQGEYIKYVTTEKEGTYIEFTYNGMKYQSVWPATLEDEENGSKAVEKAEDRQAFNERYKTIISNNGDAMSNKAVDGTIINYEKLDVNGPYNYKRRVLYEGKVEGLFDGAESDIFGGRDADPIGDGVYSGLQKRPKANEVDGEPNTMQQATNNDPSIFSDNVYTYSKSGGDKYQITADTQSAGYQGIMNYKVEDDKIEHVNLGVYERTQPDIAIVNDIERVVTHINNEQYLYQYGANTQTDKDYLEGGNLQGRFQNNVNYKYKRYLRPEQIQVDQPVQNDHDNEDRFLMTIYYRTEVKNQSDYVYLQPEIRTQYDSKYQAEVRDATQEVVQDKASRSQEDETSIAATMANEVWQTSSPLGGTNANTPSGYQEAYNTVTDKIEPGQSKVFYTAYTLKRENLKELVYATKERYFFNNIEVNAYSTYWADSKGQERLVNSDGAYAGIDVDSAAGNSAPTTNYGQQEDGSWAPADADPTETFEDDNDVAPVFELKYETPAKISGTVYLDDIVKDGENYPTAKSVGTDSGRDAGTVQDYIGNGIHEEGEVPVKDVKVELVELDESGKEILDENGNTKVRLLEEDEGHDPLSTEKFAVTTTKDDGTYSFEGFIPGEYIVKFTWGQHVTYIDPNTNNEEELTSTIVDNDPNNVDIAYVQQYKSTIFNNEERYTEMTDMKGDTTTKNRWYITPGGVEYSGKSNAIDDMEMRRKIDNDILNTGNNYEKDDSSVTYNTGTTTDNEKMLTYPDLEEDEVFSGRATSIVSRTPAFDVSQQENEYTTTKDKDKVEEKNKNIDTDYVAINLDQVDFGISERPKQDMELEKRIQRVSVKLANGETLIDANVSWDEKTGNTREQRMKIEDITGEIKQVAYPKDIVKNGDIGTFRMEVDEEILQGSTMEITYKYNIINESYLDYNLAKDEDNKELPYEFHDKAHLNRYYKYGNEYVSPIEESEVEMSPSIIIDYLDNAMGWKKYDEVNYHENDLWEEVTEDENKDSGRVTDLLYDGRFKADNNIIYEKNINSYNLHNYGIENLQKQLIGDDDDDNGNIYKFYRTILRDTTKANMDTLASDYNEKDYPEESEQLKKDTERPELDRYKGQIYLKAKEISYDDVKFVASKELSDTNVDLNFYNVAEIAQVNRTGGAIPEKMIPGDNDPTNTGHTDTQNSNFEGSTEQTYTVEHDGGWASLVTITPPTGDDTNYNYIMWTAVGIAALAILGIGTLGIKKVLVSGKAVEIKEDSRENK